MNPLVAAFRTLSLLASETPAGPLCMCPKCESVLTLAPKVVACPQCHWMAKGEPWDIAQAAANAAPKKETASRLPPILWGPSLQAPPVLPGELIPGLLHRGAKMVLGGGSKSFKTWCLADLAISLAAGVPWWGRQITKPHRILYLNLEVSAPFFIQRLQAIADAKGIAIPDTLGVWNLRGKCADHRILFPEIETHIKGEQLDGVIIDPTYKVMTGSENAQEEVASLMNSIERLGENTGAATIFGAHFAKGSAAAKEPMDRISGSGVFARDPDAILTLTRHAEKDVFTVDSVLRNCPPMDAFTLKWGFPLMRPWDADPNDLKQPGVPERAAIMPDDVLRVLLANGGHMSGGKNDPEGLVVALSTDMKVPRRAAEQAIKEALGVTIQYKQTLSGMRSYVAK